MLVDLVDLLDIPSLDLIGSSDGGIVFNGEPISSLVGDSEGDFVYSERRLDGCLLCRFAGEVDSPLALSSNLAAISLTILLGLLITLST